MAVPTAPHRRIAGPVLLLALTAVTAAWAARTTHGPVATDAGWREVSSAGFARAAEGERARWRELITGRDEELARLVASLDLDPRTATRAAVLLGLVARDLPDESEERRVIRSALMARLGARIAPPSRGETGVDLVAARVLAMDIIGPEGAGELIGGSQREEDLDVLLAAIAKHELPMEEFEWYLDLRRFGSVPHGGFGLGLERLVRWITGVEHIRETSPFPRMMTRIRP